MPRPAARDKPHPHKKPDTDTKKPDPDPIDIQGNEMRPIAPMVPFILHWSCEFHRAV